MADRILEEYEHQGKTYVIADYDTEVSYKEWVEDETPYGEIERQHWPFTPFKVVFKSHTPAPDYHCVRVHVDGVVAARMMVEGSAKELELRGFQGSLGSDWSLKEFCFSPPRPKKKTKTGDWDSADQISADRLDQLGSIVVTVHRVQRLRSEDHHFEAAPVTFVDANKKVCRPDPPESITCLMRCALQDCNRVSATAAAR